MIPTSNRFSNKQFTRCPHENSKFLFNRCPHKTSVNIHSPGVRTGHVKSEVERLASLYYMCSPSQV